MKTATQTLFGTDDPLAHLDLCRDYSRGRENPHSQKAFERAHNTISAVKQLIVDRLAALGTAGMTSKEFVRFFNENLPEVTSNLASLNGVSGRFSELRQAGIIRQLDEVREGCGVWTLVEGMR